MIFFLFGKPGVGKSTLGQRIAEQLDMIHIDCDQFYTPFDRERIRTGSFTNEESGAFLERAIRDITERRNQGYVIADQSLFRREQRQHIKDSFGDEIRLVYLDATNQKCLQRILERQGSSSCKENPHFYRSENFIEEYEGYEPPDECEPDYWITNNGPRELAEQELIRYISAQIG